MDNQNGYSGQESTFSIEDYVDIVLRRKWLILIPFVLSSIITVIVYSKLPKLYRSETLILVLPQTVPEDYVRPTITTPIAARLANISDEILSRTRLETIINELDLYPELRKKETMEEIVARMRKDISLDIKEPRRGETTSSFKIFFQGEVPETLRRVTSKLASLFIEENLKAREQQARITTDFLNKELDTAKGKLVELENAVTEFKFQHIGNLPEQKEANLGMLSQLAARRLSINESIARAENKELLLQQQLAGMRQYLVEGEATGEAGTSLQEQLQAAKNALLALKTTYTENYIEVKKIRERIKLLNEQLASAEEGSSDEAPEKSQTINPAAQDLKTQLMITQKEIERLKQEKVSVDEQVAVYEKRIEEVPRVELELAALTRDYENTKKFYEDLLNKKMEAEQAESLERKQQGEQFRILDPASLPTVPFKPNPKKVLPMGVLAGLFMGCCLAFVAEKRDTSFKSVKDAERYLGVPILAAIPLKKEHTT